MSDGIEDERELEDRTDPYYCTSCGHHATVHERTENPVGCSRCDCAAFTGRTEGGQ